MKEGSKSKKFEGKSTKSEGKSPGREVTGESDPKPANLQLNRLSPRFAHVARLTGLDAQAQRALAYLGLYRGVDVLARVMPAPRHFSDASSGSNAVGKLPTQHVYVDRVVYRSTCVHQLRKTVESAWHNGMKDEISRFTSACCRNHEKEGCNRWLGS